MKNMNKKYLKQSKRLKKYKKYCFYLECNLLSQSQFIKKKIYRHVLLKLFSKVSTDSCWNKVAMTNDS